MVESGARVTRLMAGVVRQLMLHAALLAPSHLLALGSDVSKHATGLSPITQLHSDQEEEGGVSGTSGRSATAKAAAAAATAAQHPVTRLVSQSVVSGPALYQESEVRSAARFGYPSPQPASQHSLRKHYQEIAQILGCPL